MREIFRGKRADNGEWIYGDLMQNVDCIKIREQEKDIKHISKSFEIIPETVGQYIGLTDKNGTMIWEGDIVKHYNSVYEISYITKYARFAGRNSNCIFASIPFGNTEVIGNIHDNPELLKGGVDNG